MSQFEAGPALRAVGLGLAPYSGPQKSMIRFMTEAQGLTGSDARLLRMLYERTRIETRWSCIADYARPWQEYEFYPRNPHLQPAPSTGRRMDFYREHAPAMAERACADLFSRPGACAPEEIDHVFVASCTGFLAPGLDVLLTRSLGLRPDVGRTLIGFQGCQAGLTALRLADYLCRARPAAHALIVCAEICTLHLQLERNEDNQLANALFSDGAAAALVSGAEAGAARGPRMRIDRCDTLLHPDSEGEMVWRVGDAGFELRLSSLVPRILAASVPALLERTFGVSVEELREVPVWAVHPGGIAIVDGVEKGLGLPRERLAASREVLRDYGNMSSPTIFFVLRKLLDDPAASGSGVALAFGPGLTVEALRFEKIAEPPDGEAHAAETAADHAAAPV